MFGSGYVIVLGIAGMTILCTGLYVMYNVHKSRFYKQIQKQNIEIELQKIKVEKAYEQLKSTQNQLIQSEKMASLRRSHSRYCA